MTEIDIDINQFRKNNPQYEELDNETLTKKLHNKFFNDMDYNDFSKKFNPQYSPAVEEAFKQSRADIKDVKDRTGVVDFVTSPEGLRSRQRVGEAIGRGITNVPKSLYEGTAQVLAPAVGKVIGDPGYGKRINTMMNQQNEARVKSQSHLPQGPLFGGEILGNVITYAGAPAAGVLKGTASGLGIGYLNHAKNQEDRNFNALLGVALGGGIPAISTGVSKIGDAFVRRKAKKAAEKAVGQVSEKLGSDVAENVDVVNLARNTRVNLQKAKKQETDALYKKATDDAPPLSDEAAQELRGLISEYKPIRKIWMKYVKKLPPAIQDHIKNSGIPATKNAKLWDDFKKFVDKSPANKVYDKKDISRRVKDVVYKHAPDLKTADSAFKASKEALESFDNTPLGGLVNKTEKAANTDNIIGGLFDPQVSLKWAKQGIDQINEESPEMVNKVVKAYIDNNLLKGRQGMSTVDNWIAQVVKNPKQAKIIEYALKRNPAALEQLKAINKAFAAIKEGNNFRNIMQGISTPERVIRFLKDAFLGDKEANTVIKALDKPIRNRDVIKRIIKRRHPKKEDLVEFIDLMLPKSKADVVGRGVRSNLINKGIEAKDSIYNPQQPQEE